jgi:hypothetical protein
MNRREVLEIVDSVIDANPYLKRNEAQVAEIVKVILLHYENKMNGKV